MHPVGNRFPRNTYPAGKEPTQAGTTPPATRKRRISVTPQARSRADRPSKRGPALPPRPSLSRQVEDWRAATDEAAEFLRLAREPGGMIAKVGRLAAKLEKKGHVTVDHGATDLFAGFPVYRIGTPPPKQRPTWNDVRDASQRTAVHGARHVRRRTNWPREQGNKHYHEIKPTPDGAFFSASVYSPGIPGWAGGRMASAGMSADGAMGGAVATASIAAQVPGFINTLGGGIDALDQWHAWLDMQSAAKKASIEIVTGFHALLKVMCHQAGEECAAVPTDAEWIAASQCRQALARHPKFSAEMADMSLRCRVATWRDVGFGAPAGLVGLGRTGVAIVAAADGATQALSVAAGALGDVTSGVLAPINGAFDVGHTKLESDAWKKVYETAKATMGWLEGVKHLPVNDSQSPEHQDDRHLFNAMLPACWQAHHDTAKHARFMKRCSYVRGLKGAVNSLVAWPLWIAAAVTGIPTLGIFPAVFAGGVGGGYLASMSLKLAEKVRRKREQKNDQQAADIVMATQRGDKLRKTVRQGKFEVTTTQGTFVGGGEVFAGKKTHRVDVQLSPAMGLACFATLVDKIVRDKPLDPQVHAKLLRFMIKRGVTALELGLIKQSVLAAARLRKAADPALDDEGDEWHRLQDLQNQLGPCFGLPRGATKLSDGVFLECFFGARLAQRAETQAQQHPECRQRIVDCLDGAGHLLTEPAQGLALLSKVASNLAEAAPGFHSSHCSDAEMRAIADRLFPGIPPGLFLEKCEHLLAMADQARRTGDHFDWKVDGLPMHDLALFCTFVRERWNRDVNAVGSPIRRPLDGPSVLAPDSAKDSHVRRMAELVSDRYPLPWHRGRMGYAQRLNDRDGFALMTHAQIERCMQRTEPVPAAILEVRSMAGGRSGYRELLKREEASGDGSRPVVNMLLMKQADKLDRLVMPGGPGSIAQIGAELAGRDDGLRLQQSRWNASKDSLPRTLLQATELGVCFKRYARDGRLRRHSVMVSRATNKAGRPDGFRVYDPATGKESRLPEATDMGSAIKHYIAQCSRGRRVDSAALDFVDLFRVQSGVPAA